VFSKEKYIFPKDIKTQYSIIHQNFESIFDFIKNERDFKSNFRTNEVGDVVFEGDYQDMDGITEKLKQYNREQVFTQTIQNIEVIRKKIEEYFENIQ
ncbi:MAG: hypothetical protein J0I88_03130, partial [Chryseobacterium sp.]|nr:hypothetical protein [Chryseobacterium sp.]